MNLIEALFGRPRQKALPGPRGIVPTKASAAAERQFAYGQALSAAYEARTAIEKDRDERLKKGGRQ